MKWSHRDAVKAAAFRQWEANPAKYSRYGTREAFQMEALSQAEQLAAAHTMSFGSRSLAALGNHVDADFRFVAAELCQLAGEPITTPDASTMKFAAGDVIALTAAPRMEFTAGKAGGPRQFKGVAYSGAPVRMGRTQLVVDLAGMSIPGGQIPILRQHDSDRPIGFATCRIANGRLEVEGTLTNATESGRETSALADDGFNWRLSIGFSVLETAEIAPGEMKTVNGRSVAGPAVILTRTQLSEVSFVPVPADASEENSVEVLQAA